jgi:hypothetical protein
MNGTMEGWENNLRAVAQGMPYPPTPDIAGTVRQRLERAHEGHPKWRLALVAATVVLALLVGLLSVPAVRAAVLEFLQIGAIRIILPASTSTPTPTPLVSATPGRTPLPIQTLRPVPTPRDLIALDNLQGETTLDEAIQKASFTLQLPTFPVGIGKPNRVFVQDMGGAMVILVWTEAGNPQKADLILYEIAPGSWAGIKGAPRTVESTQVNGREAAWAEGPYMLNLANGDTDMRRLIVGHVLIWDKDGVTYRLESNLDLNQAVKIAESLEPIP